jgi:hypothetical protein
MKQLAPTARRGRLGNWPISQILTESIEEVHEPLKISKQHSAVSQGKNLSRCVAQPAERF